MKLISLNTWCGIKYEALRIFIENQSKGTDIFCFQEVRNGNYLDEPKETEERINFYEEIKNLLTDFTGYYTEMNRGVGLAIFIRNVYPVEKIETTEILSAKDTEHIKMSNGNSYYARLLQAIYLENKNFVIYNFHGLPGGGKKDTPERDLQTKRLLEVLHKDIKGKIIVGDFNLAINTEAISILSNQLRNLIKENNIKTTRSHYYKHFAVSPLADYIFVSKDVTIENFKVLPDEVSDHLALLLEFN